MTRLTQRLTHFVAQTRFEDLPPPVVAECKRLLLDTIGCALGAVRTESGRIALGGPAKDLLHNAEIRRAYLGG